MKRIIVPFIIIMSLAACKKGPLDQKIDNDLTPGQVFMNYSRMQSLGYGVYSYLLNGNDRIGNSLLAAATDDAEQTDAGSSIQSFNLGSWNQYANPDDVWGHYYKGIRSANIFLKGTVNYKQILVKDTLTLTGKRDYQNNVLDIGWMRGEVRFLRAYFYFELAKRYGGVPVISRVLNLDDSTSIPRSSFDDIIQFIVDECNAVEDSVRIEWHGYRDADVGRVTKGTVLALKSRALLFAASPLHNTDHDITKWEAAAEAAHEVIAMHKYSLENNYQKLFIAPLSYQSDEVIFSIREGSQNFMEKENYPIGTEGGQSGTTPSQNLVSAYEKLPGWDAAHPYQNRDPRLQMSVVVNNSQWNGRDIEAWKGGRDGEGKLRATKTGYYLKKFLSPDLDLTNNVKTNYAWIVFRYGEILLNYAEAMNEAYGPDADPKGYGMTAREAINDVRSRPGVDMPPVVAGSQAEIRDRIKHERRIELAFEGHRFWDLRRWKDAVQALSTPLMGVKITLNSDLSYTYTPYKVENRTFTKKMNYYPVPQTEIDKSHGLIKQNKGW